MPRVAPAVLALDLGTSSVRSALFDAHGRCLRGSSAKQDYRVRHSADHGAVLDPAALLRATRRCLRATSRLTKDSTLTVSGSGFWHSLLGLDRRGDPVTPVYTWADARGARDAMRLRELLDERTVQQRTGCMLRASFWPAKLRWLRRTEPRLFRRVARWVSPAEWVFEKLFAVRACSPSMASGTGLYDLARRDWDDELLELSGLTRSQLNPLEERVEGRRALVFPALGDGAAGNLGSGATAPGSIAINVGTSAAVRTVLRGKTSLPFGLFRFLIDGKRTLLGGAISNAGSLRAWSERELRLPGRAVALEKILRERSPASAGLTILPFLVKERAPTWPEHLEGTIAGLTQATTAADLFHALTLAPFLRLAAVLEQVEGATGRARRIIAAGGIVDSPAALQILADALGRRIEVCREKEASLRGAAIYSLEALGHRIPPPRRGRIMRPGRAAAAQARVARARQESLEALLGKKTTSRDRAPSASS
ncbi:MAG: gluconokinase [Spartobacteria bacterium]